MTPKRDGAAVGVALFVALSFLGSWFVAATLRVFDLNVQPGPLGTRLFATSLLYAATMGWQPLVATWVVRRWIDSPDRLDLGLRSCLWSFSFVGGLAAIGFAAAATALAWAAASGVGRAVTLQGQVERELVAGAPSLGGLVVLSLAFLGTLALVVGQAFTEEIGWRGYFLPRAMERFGRWGGLVIHGAVWGLWYAPVLFFSSHGQLAWFDSIARSLGFVLSCVLLGTLLGWLRLASRSVLPAILANATLTLVAGLPYVVLGMDAGLRAAVFGPPGWIVLLAGVAALTASRWRAVVQIPEPLPAAAAPLGSHALALELEPQPLDRAPGKRTLH